MQGILLQIGYIERGLSKRFKLTLKHIYLYVTRTYLFIMSMSLVCHSYVTRMYLYVIRMSLVCTRMSSVCHSYVLVCHSYVTRMSSVCHSYVVLPRTVTRIGGYILFLRGLIIKLRKGNYIKEVISFSTETFNIPHLLPTLTYVVNEIIHSSKRKAIEIH